MSRHPLLARLERPGPKRVLALDGGGIRGLVALGFLERIEALLRARYGRPDYVLGDYFDLIGGTSTGAMIATTLALGWPVAEIRDVYLRLGAEAFRPRKRWLGRASLLLGPRFDDKPLHRILADRLGERTLGSTDIRSALVIVAKRADTASVWAFANVPTHPFYTLNRDILLREVVRASTAAPTYFAPQWIRDVGGGEEAVFVDGAVSTHNNPSLLLLMVATLGGYGLRWPVGEDALLLCSVGTGLYNATTPRAALRRFGSLQWLDLLGRQLVDDASELNELMLQWLGTSPTARTIDLQVGNLSGDRLGERPLLTYLRFDVRLERAALAELGLDYDDAAVQRLREMSAVENIAELDRVGRAAAERRVRAEHFPAAFDARGISIGVTGHRRLEPADRAASTALRERVAAVLARAAEAAPAGPRRIVSALAEGADRIVAEEALAAGWTLHAILPLARDEYEADFAAPESRAAFRSLLARAASVEEPAVGAGEAVEAVAERTQAYARAGGAVLAASDALIAIWDGAPAKGPGGTADIVAAAREQGLPVVWIAARPPFDVRGGVEVVARPRAAAR